MTMIQTTKNQTKAVQRLVAAGISATDAYKGVEDAAFAAAVANKKLTDKELQKIVRTWKKATKAAQIYAAQVGLAEKNAQFKGLQNTLKAIDKARAAYGNLPEEAVQEIIDNEDLRELILKGKFNDKEVLDALQNAANKREIEIKIKMQTREGMQELFDEGYSKAMEWFNAQEKKIELDFEFKTLRDQDIIEKAEDAIAALEYRIDDLQAGLVEIEDAEELVNEKYDKRIEALDKVNEINQDILEQQKSQLTIADALTQGDIAAAAKAVQDARAQEAERRAEQSRTGLDAARENELANIRNSLGRTRKEIEADIAKLQKEIFNIEEQTLEPARERVRLAEVQKREAIQALTLLGKSKLEWEAVKNQVDLARTNSTLYMDAIKLALDIVQKLVDAWNNMDTKKTVFLEIIESRVPAEEAAPEEESKEDSQSKGKGKGTKKDTKAPKPGAPKPGTSKPTTKTPKLPKVAPPVQGPGLGGRDTRQSIGNRTSAAAVEQAKGYIAPGVNRNTPIRTASPISIGGMTLQPVSISPNSPFSALYRSMGGVVKLPKAEPPPTQTMNMGGPVKYMPMGGLVPYMNSGGMFKPKGTDTVPAMLTPGEFVVRRYAVQGFGLDKLKAINDGTYNDSSVYNYNLNVNVKSDANADEIAQTVMAQIKRIDGQRIRGNKF